MYVSITVTVKVNTVLMVKGRMGLEPVLSIKVPDTINTMLNFEVTMTVTSTPSEHPVTHLNVMWFVQFFIAVPSIVGCEPPQHDVPEVHVRNYSNTCYLQLRTVKTPLGGHCLRRSLRVAVKNIGPFWSCFWSSLKNKGLTKIKCPPKLNVHQN